MTRRNGWSVVLMAALAWGPVRTAAASRDDAWGRSVAAAAQWYLEGRGRLGRRDCSGLVTAILAHAGARGVAGNSHTYWSDARREGRVHDQPQPGDLAFFDRTYDANRNGRLDDVLTHVAVVVAVDDDGTVELVHFGSGQIKALRLSLTQPAVRREGGQVLNDYLRSPGYGPPNGKRLAGQLLRGFARPPRR